MKKFLLIILLCLMAVGIQAQTMYINTTYVPATIMFRDGHEETYDKVQMPTKFQEKITVKLEDEGKRKISAEDILFITYWREKFPEDKHTIYCLIVHEKKDIFPEWGVPVMASDWCVVFRCYDSYGIDRKTGDLMFTITLDQSLSAIGVDSRLFTSIYFGEAATNWFQNYFTNYYLENALQRVYK